MRDERERERGMREERERERERGMREEREREKRKRPFCSKVTVTS